VPGKHTVKIILLGDSAVGKSKLVERFLMDGYKPHTLSTYALTLYQHKHKRADGSEMAVDIWDTAGQEQFSSLHPSYYYGAHACIMVFDATRKVTYNNLRTWWDELQEYCKGVPTFVVANKIDEDYGITTKSFKFASERDLPFYFVSAADGTNVVKAFQDAIEAAIAYKESPVKSFYNDVVDLLADSAVPVKQSV